MSEQIIYPSVYKMHEKCLSNLQEPNKLVVLSDLQCKKHTVYIQFTLNQCDQCDHYRDIGSVA